MTITGYTALDLLISIILLFSQLQFPGFVTFILDPSYHFYGTSPVKIYIQFLYMDPSNELMAYQL